MSCWAWPHPSLSCLLTNSKSEIRWAKIASLTTRWSRYAPIFDFVSQSESADGVLFVSVSLSQDLINAAQKIKMNSPNVAKRASSIQLGSSSIATPGSGRWRTFGSGSKPTTPIGSATSGTSPNSSAKRFSVLWWDLWLRSYCHICIPPPPFPTTGTYVGYGRVYGVCLFLILFLCVCVLYGAWYIDRCVKCSCMCWYQALSFDHHPHRTWKILKQNRGLIGLRGFM